MTTVQSAKISGQTFAPIRPRRFLIDGRPGESKDLTGLPFVAAGADLPEPDTAYGFSEERRFCRWAAETPHAERLARVLGTVQLAQELEGTETGVRALARHEIVSGRLQDDLAELAREAELEIESTELFLLAANHRSVLEPPLFDPTLLFDRVLDSGPPPVFSNPVFPVAGPIPSLFRFNDKASGALVLGVCTLFDRTFFRGPAAFLLGAGTYVLDDLGFDNRAASAIAV